MPAKKEYKTDRQGVYYILINRADGAEERCYYIRFKKNGKLYVEKAGRAGQGMTVAKAARVRAAKIDGRVPTKREEKEAAKAKKKEEENKWTIDRLWQEYISSRSLKGLSQDRSRYLKYIKPAFCNKEPQEIAPLDVDRIRIKMLKKFSPQHVKLTLALLRRIILYGANKGLCAPLPFQIEMPRVNNETTEDLSPEQLNRLLEAIEQDHDIQVGNLMRMALFTGMRRGELLRLQWSDIDFDRGFITIRDPKGGINQTIPLNEAARDILKNHPREYDYVFPGRDGGQRKEARRGLNRIKARAGLPEDFRPLHGLRHAYASMLASSGQVDLYTLQKLLTHKSPAMTQRYAHLRDEALRKASDLAGELVLSARRQAKQAEEDNEAANE